MTLVVLFLFGHFDCATLHFYLSISELRDDQRMAIFSPFGGTRCTTGVVVTLVVRLRQSEHQQYGQNLIVVYHGVYTGQLQHDGLCVAAVGMTGGRIVPPHSMSAGALLLPDFR